MSGRGAIGRRRESAAADQTRALRLIVALVVMAASAGCIAASTLTWLSLPDDTGGVIRLSGWGAVSGGPSNGQNINDAAQGFTSYRPGVIAVIIGTLALLAAFGIALVARGRTLHRIPAAVLTLCGLGGLAWGLVKALSPGDLDGVYADVKSEVSSGAGPWLTAAGSVVLLAAAVVIFTGLLDPPRPIARRGIQPG